jgi:acetylornithine/succinyldiaminopimelate/putrescine aminotransferase
LPKQKFNVSVEKSSRTQGNAMKKRRITDLSMEERATLFAQAGREAVERALKAGLPVTGTKDGKIVKRYPDGREEVLKDLRHSSEPEKASA